MVGDSVLREIVGSDALGPVHRANLTLPHDGCRGIDLLLLAGEHTGTQHPHPCLTVLQLRLLVLHRHDDSGGEVGDAHGGVGRIHRLAPGATRAIDIDFEIILADLYLFGLVYLGEDKHARSRCMDASLRLGRWNPLHTMNAALVLEVSPDPLCGVTRVALDRELHILDAAKVARGLLDDLGFPLLRLRIVQVHAQEIASEQGGFCSTFSHLDLHDHITAVVLIARDEQPTQALLHSRKFRRDVGKLLGERRIVRRHLGRRLDVVREGDPTVICVDDTAELGVSPIHFL